MRKKDMVPLMNDTKWREIRDAMCSIEGALPPRWRTRDLGTGFISEWDGGWYYHFASSDYSWIEWLEIELASDACRAAVLSQLRRIHVPGAVSGGVARIYGYAAQGQQVEYITGVA